MPFFKLSKPKICDIFSKIIFTYSLFIIVGCKNETNDNSLSNEIKNTELDSHIKSDTIISNYKLDSYTMTGIKINKKKYTHFKHTRKDQEFFHFEDIIENTRLVLSFYDETRVLMIFKTKGNKERIEAVYLYQDDIGFVEKDLKKSLNEKFIQLLKEDGYSDEMLKGSWEEIPQ